MFEDVLEIQPFSVRVRTPFRAAADHLSLFYGARGRASGSVFVDFDVEVRQGRGLRRFWRPQASFAVDGEEPFFPLPAEQAPPMFEWGLNWCVAQRPLGYIVMHAAVLARGDRAIMMPGFPGAGKSTMCAALAFCEGWRLLSDELAILDPADGLVVPHPRPVSIKNESIAVVSDFPGVRVGPVYRDTRKGDIAHAACPPLSIEAANQRVRVAWIVFPRFDKTAEPHCEEIARLEAFALIAEQSFNRERMGATGFRGLCDLVGASRCFEIGYRSTQEGLDMVRQLSAA